MRLRRFHRVMGAVFLGLNAIALAMAIPTLIVPQWSVAHYHVDSNLEIQKSNPGWNSSYPYIAPWLSTPPTDAFNYREGVKGVMINANGVNAVKLMTELCHPDIRVSFPWGTFFHHHGFSECKLSPGEADCTCSYEGTLLLMTAHYSKLCRNSIQLGQYYFSNRMAVLYSMCAYIGVSGVAAFAGLFLVAGRSRLTSWWVTGFAAVIELSLIAIAYSFSVRLFWPQIDCISKETVYTPTNSLPSEFGYRITRGAMSHLASACCAVSSLYAVAVVTGLILLMLRRQKAVSFNSLELHHIHEVHSEVREERQLPPFIIGDHDDRGSSHTSSFEVNDTVR